MSKTKRKEEPDIVGPSISMGRNLKLLCTNFRPNERPKEMESLPVLLESYTLPSSIYLSLD